MTINTGGPAFPHLGLYKRIDGDLHPVPTQHGGMTLRDYFAAKAPSPSSEWIETQRQLDRQRNPHNDSHKPPIRDLVELDAAWRYKWADAMLKERNND